MAARWNRLIAILSILCLSWLGMMAVHELGHIVGAVITGGDVVRVVLHPGTISRTDVSPNPSPLIVAWAGPVLGCLIPALMVLGVFCIAPSARTVNDSKTSHHLSGSRSLPTEQGADQDRMACLSGRCSRATNFLTIISLLKFFSGFCFIANGAYLGIGVLDRIGDADEILKAGSPPSVLIAFGTVACVSGILIWHQMGSPTVMFRSGREFDPWLVKGLVATLVLVVVVECLISPV